MSERGPSGSIPELSGRELAILALGAIGFRIEQGPNANSPEQREVLQDYPEDSQPVFVDQIDVKEGVVCDVYIFPGDESKDLGIITVRPGHNTPLQKVLDGERTIEGHISGASVLRITRNNGDEEEHRFPKPDGEQSEAIEVKKGDTMQWETTGDEELVFYEICEPPYEDGRFENLD